MFTIKHNLLVPKFVFVTIPRFCSTEPHHCSSAKTAMHQFSAQASTWTGLCIDSYTINATLYIWSLAVLKAYF